MDIVSLTMKERMVAGADDDVEIAGRPAVESRISLSREANSLPIARARFNADGQRLVADLTFIIADIK